MANLCRDLEFDDADDVTAVSYICNLLTKSAKYYFDTFSVHSGSNVGFCYT